MKRLVLASILCAPSVALADTTPQTLPFTQDWTDTGLITTNDDWSGVPGITGYLGSTTADLPTDTDPQTVIEPLTVVDVIANLAAVTTAGGVAEFEFTDPTVAFQGSGTADAPNIIIYLNTTGVGNVRVEYDLIDLDSNTDDSVQQVALQYRLSDTGDYTNVPAGYIADATADGAAGMTTHIDLELPELANQAHVEIRIITTNAAGSDEWVGIDNISITEASAPPTATGLANPASQVAGMDTQLTAETTPGTLPPSTGITVTCDLSPIGGSATQALADDGASGDGAADDGTFGFLATITAGTDAGAYDLACTVADAEARSSDFTIALEVLAVCGDGVVEGTEECDDSGTADGDGCSATCTVEDGYTCTGEPSLCTDIDECTAMTDDCHANAECTNTEPGFTCACAEGFTGDGVTACDPVCGDALIVAGEECDDDGAENGDGCDSACQIEDGWSCTGEPSVCTPDCGDGMVDGAEECDDMNTTDGDGCDASCVVEAGWSCTGEPSTCTPEALCGDGVVDAGEECDDGDADSEDGCDATCTVETGFVCDDSEPSVCEADSDGDLVPDDDDNCPDAPNPSQADEDDDGIGNACDDPVDDGGDGGCCSTSSDSRGAAGFALLALVTLVTLRRRRR